MDNRELEQKWESLSLKVDRLFFSIKACLLSLIFFLSVSNIFIALSISNFNRIYSDILPGKPLPLLTTTVFSLRSQLVILAICWPLVAIACALLRQKASVSLLVFIALLIFIVTQVMLTWLALYLPLMSVFQGMAGPEN